MSFDSAHSPAHQLRPCEAVALTLHNTHTHRNLGRGPHTSMAPIDFKDTNTSSRSKESPNHKMKAQAPSPRWVDNQRRWKRQTYLKYIGSGWVWSGKIISTRFLPLIPLSLGPSQVSEDSSQERAEDPRRFRHSELHGLCEK